MDQVIKNRWVNALRSGNYEQGTGYLHKEDRFCCLGVLCEIAVGEGVLPDPEVKTRLDHESSTFTYYRYDGSGALLPEKVAQWSGLDENPDALTVEVEYEGECISLAGLNDREELSFGDIANVIEAQL